MAMKRAESSTDQGSWPHGPSAGSGAEPQGLSLVLDSVSPPEPEKGSQVGGVCPRSGFIRLTSEVGRVGVFPTVCKSWRCNICRRKKKSLVIERIQFGCYNLGSCFNITLTFRVVGQDRRDADSAERVLRRYWRSLRLLFPSLEYFKVVEMTMKGQPHYHVIIGGLDTSRRDHCRRAPEVDERNLRARCLDEVWCLEHVFSAAWEQAAGDSYIVQADAVYAVRGLGFYLGKYLTKTFFEEDQDGLDLGFRRRWSSSSGWPRFEQLQLRGTLKSRPGRSGWRRVDIMRKEDAAGWTNPGRWLEQTPTDGDFEKVGTAQAVEMDRKKSARIAGALAERILRGSNKRT